MASAPGGGGGTGASTQQQQQQQQRLSLATLDPRTLYPTPDNVASVTRLLARVEHQLEEDRARYERDPTVARAREMRNETLQYYGLLNDWLTVAAQQRQAQAQPGPPGQPAAQAPAQAPAPATAPGQGPVAARVHNGVRFEEAREALLPVQVSADRVEEKKCLVDGARQLVCAFGGPRATPRSPTAKH